ncbi:hypothetical protein, partial [Burkholderia guangdongensis]|uniref:hypothetical protein n=1 Tax=Burkholderia guangdongensis TaxID=1792500 RepID=UPI001C543406
TLQFKPCYCFRFSRTGRSLKADRSYELLHKPDLLLCETLDTFAYLLRGYPRLRSRRHQAPTLIGCSLLKSISVKNRETRFVSPFSAALRYQQQRSEIMISFLQLVNNFFNFPSLTA